MTIADGGDALAHLAALRDHTKNKAWLELALTAADLPTRAQALCFVGDLARCEPATFRYRICGIAAKLTRLRTAPWPG